MNGVLTSTFGYRKHPILGVVRLHKGVDWKAPVGTPIMAAFDGTIAYIGDGKGYGNVIRIDHGGGRATAYAHMSRFEPTMKRASPCMPAKSSAISARQAFRPARICISSSTRIAPPSIRSAAPRPRSPRARQMRTSGSTCRTAGWDAARQDSRLRRRPTAQPSKSWSTGSSMSRAAARRAPRTRNRRPPGLASSSSRPGSG